MSHLAVGGDAGRLKKYSFSDGPVHVGASSQTINIDVFDTMLTSVREEESGQVIWEEKAPCSNRNTRVLAIIAKDKTSAEASIYTINLQHALKDIEGEVLVISTSRGVYKVTLEFPIFR